MHVPTTAVDHASEYAAALAEIAHEVTDDAYPITLAELVATMKDRANAATAPEQRSVALALSIAADLLAEAGAATDPALRHALAAAARTLLHTEQT